MKPVLLEVRDRLETLCDGIEMNTVGRENILSSVRYLLSLVNDTCERTKDPMDATTVSRNFTTGLPNNNAFIKAADDVFYGKYLIENAHHNGLTYDSHHGHGHGHHGIDIDGGDNENKDDLNTLSLNGNIESEYTFLEWGLLLIAADDFSKIVDELSLRCSDPEIGDNILRHLSQTIYSCVTSEHQKVFHLDSDQFALLTPIDGMCVYVYI